MTWGGQTRSSLVTVSSVGGPRFEVSTGMVLPRDGSVGPSSGARRVHDITVQDLPRLLLEQSLVTEAQMQYVLGRQWETGAFIGDILHEERILEEGVLVAFIVKHYKIPHLYLRNYALDESLLALVSRHVCLHHHVVPIDRMGRDLTLAMVNPFDTGALDAIHQRCAELQIRPILCTRCHFDVVAEKILERRRGAAAICSLLRRHSDRVVEKQDS